MKKKKINGKNVRTKRESLSLLQVRMANNEMHFNRKLTNNITDMFIEFGVIKLDWKNISCRIRLVDKYLYLDIATEDKPNAVMLRNHLIVIKDKGLKTAYFKRYKSTYNMTILNPHPNRFTIIIDPKPVKVNVVVSRSLVDTLERK